MNISTRIRKNEFDEYEVHLYVEGQHDDSWTYYTTDKDDAKDTATAMRKHASCSATA